MIPQAQTRPHPNGDCLRSCIASLLELPISEVPDWLEHADKEPDPENDYPGWYFGMQQWLMRRGYAFVEVQLEKKTWMPLPFDMFAIFIGPKQTELGVFRHAIVGVCRDGKFIPVFDPYAPEGDPAKAFERGYVEAVCLLVPLDPAKLRKYAPIIAPPKERLNHGENHAGGS